MLPILLLNIDLPFWSGTNTPNFKVSVEQYCLQHLFPLVWYASYEWVEFLIWKWKIINFYNVMGGNRKILRTLQKNWTTNFKANIKIPLKIVYFPKPKTAQRLPCFYKIFSFKLTAVGICSIRSWPVLLLIQSKKKHRGKAQGLSAIVQSF